MFKKRQMVGCAFSALAMLTAGPAYSSTARQHSLAGSGGSSVVARDVSKPIKWGKPVFQTSFGGSRLNARRWQVYDDPSGTYSGWRRTRASVKIRRGTLELVGHYQKPYGYVGGGLSYAFNRTYGRWVVRFRADRGAGYEPVVLLWPKGTWPNDGEIDMAEISSAQRRGAGEFLHLGRDNRFIGQDIPSTVDFSKWHTLAVDWLPGNITFWLDGKQLWRVNHRQGNNNYVPNTPFHLAMQIDEGCADHRCRPDKATPKRTVMQVAWVRIYAAPR